MRIFYFVVLILSFVACIKPKTYTYRVTNINQDHPDIYVFFTDSLEYKGDTLGYHNSFGNFIIMSEEAGKDCLIEKLK